MLDLFIELLAKFCLILVIVTIAVVLIVIIIALVLAIIEIIKKNKIKNDTLKAMMDELDKLEKNK